MDALKAGTGGVVPKHLARLVTARHKWELLAFARRDIGARGGHAQSRLHLLDLPWRLNSKEKGEEEKEEEEEQEEEEEEEEVTNQGIRIVSKAAGQSRHKNQCESTTISKI